MEITQWLLAADLMSTVLLFIVVMRQQEQIIKSLTPKLMELMIMTLQANNQRHEEAHRLLEQLIHSRAERGDFNVNELYNGL